MHLDHHVTCAPERNRRDSDNRSIRTSYSYDALNRLIQKKYSDGTSDRYLQL